MLIPTNHFFRLLFDAETNDSQKRSAHYSLQGKCKVPKSVFFYACSDEPDGVVGDNLATVNIVGDHAQLYRLKVVIAVARASSIAAAVNERIQFRSNYTCESQKKLVSRPQ